MKIVIENRDIDDPAETKEIESVDLDLASWSETPETPVPSAPNYSQAIELAAAVTGTAMIEEAQRQKVRDAQAAFAAGQKALADQIKSETGLTIGYKKGWAYKPRPKVAYNLWKRVIPMFIERPQTLDMKPKALVEMLGPNEPNYKITRDMLYAKLNKLALADLKRMLEMLGVALEPQLPVSIRSMQKQLKQRRDGQREDLDVEKFSGRFEIRGDTAFVNGTPYTIQAGSTGKPRIKRNGEWLSLDALRVFCRKTG